MKNKKGKKLVVLGAMAALLTLIGVSGSQTYAKYVESKEVTSQTATVAKWGYVVSADANELFGNAYDLDDADGSTVGVYAADSSLVVKASSDAATVVAPGTKGQMSFTVNGHSEVDTVFTFSGDSKDIKLSNGNDEYLPLKWSLSVTDTADTLEGEPSVTDKSLDDVLTALTGTAFHVNANTNVNFTVSISWYWLFEDLYDHDDNPATPEVAKSSGVDTYNTNEADTILGILAKGGSYGIGNEFGFDYDTLISTYDAPSETKVSLDLTVTASQEQVSL